VKNLKSRFDQETGTHGISLLVAGFKIHYVLHLARARGSAITIFTFLLKRQNSQTHTTIMSSLSISTNVSLDRFNTSDIISQVSKSISQIIGKPMAVNPFLYWTCLRIRRLMSFGGTKDPTAYEELVSIGGLSAGISKKLSSIVTNILDSKLSVPKFRFYIKLFDVK
ncbi:hypothetical protein KI387_027132, partial [Taxus chinensis]